MTAAEYFIETLRGAGIEWMATLCGHGLDPIFQAARRAGLRLVDTRNEQTASYIAEYAGRLTRRPGVCAVSSGVAHANAMTGVVDAWLDQAPMLLVSGAGALRTAGMGHFQDLDQVRLARAVTKFARVIDCAERVVEITSEALRQAASPPPGPVHLTFPMDVQQTEVPRDKLVCARPPRLAGLPNLDTQSIAEALARAHRPLLVGGGGTYYAGTAGELMEFAERYSIPAVVPIWDRGVIDRPIEAFLGVIGAATGGPTLLAEADCVVLAGATPDYRVGFLQPGAVDPGARLFTLDAFPQNLREVYERKGGKRHDAWLAEARRRREAFRSSIRENGLRQAAEGLHAIHILEALQKVLTNETVLLIDGGSIGQWAHQLLCDRYPGHWLTCGRSGVVGWGIGGAMAARLVFPQRPILLLSGDGAFTFNVSDLECAVREKLPFVALVADDQGWGITRAGHLKQFGEPISSSLGPIAFDRLAQSLGARGAVARTAEQIGSLLQEALDQPAVTVLHVPIVGGNPT